MDYILERGSVLVHCHFGVSRSATVVLAYLMHRCRIPLKQAHNLVQQRRSQIQPNKGFWKQLRTFERYLKTGDSLSRCMSSEGSHDRALHESIVCFVTCRDIPEHMENYKCWKWLEAYSDPQHNEILLRCLNLICSRGAPNCDVEWFRCLCERLEERQTNPCEDAPLDRAIAILMGPTSDFAAQPNYLIHRCQFDRIIRCLLNGD